MLKFADNPALLYPQDSTVRQITGQWWVAHTKARAEKVFAWDLRDRDIPYFLPMTERIKISGGRKRRVLLPLFTSYVFFCGDDDQRLAALSTNRLCQTILVRDQEQLIDELAAIEQVLTSKTPLDPCPRAAIGQRCRVTAGPFQGIEGTVIQRGGVTRLVLQVSLLRQGAALEIDADLLETVE